MMITLLRREALSVSKILISCCDRRIATATTTSSHASSCRILHLIQRAHFATTSTSNSTTAPSNTSERSRFRTSPVNRNILSYIEQIRVGLPKSSARTKKRQKRRRIVKRGRSSEDIFRAGSFSNLWNPHEEQEYFRRQSKNFNQKSSHRLRRRGTGSGGSGVAARSGSFPPPPPPPFGAPGKADKIHRLPVKIIGSIGSSEEEFPRATKGLPEIAIAGRSNVGKSTLLNALLYGNKTSSNAVTSRSSSSKRRRRSTTVKLPKGLKAITSSRPGETRRLTFYQLSAKVIKPRGLTGQSTKSSSTTTRGHDISNKDPSSGNSIETSQPSKLSSFKVSLLLVDLPGYGFAYASTEQSQKWQALMESYIVHRGKSLKRVMLLIDARHGIKRADIEFLDSLQRSLRTLNNGEDVDKNATTKKRVKKIELPPIQLVLTKCDLVSQTDLARRVVSVRQQLSASLTREPSSLPIMMVSARSSGQEGVLELQKELAALTIHGNDVKPPPNVVDPPHGF